MILAGAGAYLLVRFGFGFLLKHCTVHRGMFHSLPAAVIFGEIAFLLAPSDDLGPKLFMAGAVVVGFLSHLLLDEIYSVDCRGAAAEKVVRHGPETLGPQWRGRADDLRRARRAFGRARSAAAVVLVAVARRTVRSPSHDRRVDRQRLPPLSEADRRLRFL